MPKLSQLERAIQNLRDQRAVLDKAIQQLESQQATDAAKKAAKQEKGV